MIKYKILPKSLLRNSAGKIQLENNCISRNIKIIFFFFRARLKVARRPRASNGGHAPVAVDTRTSLGTLPRPIAAVYAARCARAPSHFSLPSARAGEGRRAVSFSASLRYAGRGARRFPLSPPLNLSSAGASRRTPPSDTPVSWFLSIVWRGDSTPRERATERDSRDRTRKV